MTAFGWWWGRVALGLAAWWCWRSAHRGRRVEAARPRMWSRARSDSLGTRSTRWMRRRTMDDDLFAAQVLERVARELRLGATVPVALDRLIADRTDDVGDDQRVVMLQAWSEQLQRGDAPLVDTAEIESLAIVRASLGIVHATGGRAAASLDALASSARMRRDVGAEARALATQGRISAALIGMLPVAYLLLMTTGDGQVRDSLIASEIAGGCVVIGLALEAIGAMWMRRIVRSVSAEPHRRWWRPGRDPPARALVQTIELWRVAHSSGLAPYETLELLAGASIADASGWSVAVLDRFRRGQSLSDALQATTGAWPWSRPLAHLLIESLEGGASIDDALKALADQERADVRRSIERRARAVPVRLLFPLVLLILPAFMLMVVGPMVVVAVDRGSAG